MTIINMVTHEEVGGGTSYETVKVKIYVSSQYYGSSFTTSLYFLTDYRVNPPSSYTGCFVREKILEYTVPDSTTYNYVGEIEAVVGQRYGTQQQGSFAHVDIFDKNNNNIQQTFSYVPIFNSSAVNQTPYRSFVANENLNEVYIRYVYDD